jgi:hypothetical protein
LSMLVSTSRISAALHLHDISSEAPRLTRSGDCPVRLGHSTEPNSRDVGPPPYVMNC